MEKLALHIHIWQINANIFKVMRKAFSVIFTFRCNLQCNKEQRNQIKITKQ